ncbi:hypothetical protein ACFVT2_13560 [Streptomyces sp. NPDC058000]|uniref:hypothetical protein n=1 Tax=Streptomyces sp. NPDC058000 TaxID=3346299 RepID=UPI0036EAF51E
MMDGVRSAGGTAMCSPDQETAVQLLHSILQPGDVVLVKASRGAQFQQLADALLNSAADRPQTGGVCGRG